MLEVMMSVIFISGGYLVYEMIKYKKIIEKDERYNSESAPVVDQEKYKSGSDTKIPKAKTQNKRKYNRTKKTSAKSKLK